MQESKLLKLSSTIICFRTKIAEHAQRDFVRMKANQVQEELLKQRLEAHLYLRVSLMPGWHLPYIHMWESCQQLRLMCGFLGFLHH